MYHIDLGWYKTPNLPSEYTTANYCVPQQMCDKLQRFKHLGRYKYYASCDGRSSDDWAIKDKKYSNYYDVYNSDVNCPIENMGGPCKLT